MRLLNLEGVLEDQPRGRAPRRFPRLRDEKLGGNRDEHYWRAGQRSDSWAYDPLRGPQHPAVRSRRALRPLRHAPRARPDALRPGGPRGEPVLAGDAYGAGPAVLP